MLLKINEEIYKIFYVHRCTSRSSITMKIVTMTTKLCIHWFVDHNPHVRRVSLIFPAGTPRRFCAADKREQNGFAAYLVLIRRLSASRYVRGVFTGVKDDAIFSVAPDCTFENTHSRLY